VDRIQQGARAVDSTTVVWIWVGLAIIVLIGVVYKLTLQ